MKQGAGPPLNDPLVVSTDGGERGLYRLFAHLLRAGAHAAPQQGGYVGAVGAIAGAFGDGAPERGGEAGDGAGVAGGTVRAYAQQDRVPVAVVAELLDRERVPRGLALVPQRPARAAVEVRLARLT